MSHHYRFLLLSGVAISISLGLLTWLLLPPLFSLLIILSLAYMADHCLRVLEVEANRVPQSSEFQEQARGEDRDDTALAVTGDVL
ncbi:MAG TPA: hypothetical protein VGO91_17780 [Pyrinomonadaceae bacterium]|jgi:hypothetical protein|nr:hypothetical protein [Pyrinomonadaceae bacterium]